MSSQRKKGIQAIFWAGVFLLPLVTGVFHLGSQDERNSWLDVWKTSLAFLGYCLLVGILGPRLLTRMNVFEGSAHEAVARNRMWLERSVIIGLMGFALALWSGLAG